MFDAATRGVALFLGVFTIVNVVGDLRFARANTNVWWLDLWPLPLPVARVALIAIALVLLIYAFRPGMETARRIRQAVLYVAAIAAVLSAARFYTALARHEIRTVVPLPLSLLVAVLLTVIAIGHTKHYQNRPLAIAVAVVIAAVLFPMLQVFFFGVTDYRRPAEAIVVFGARANADGTASDALADRVKTACHLYRAGFAPRIIMSGGAGEGNATEPQVMRTLAQQLGVPPAAIVEDTAGINTEATVRNVVKLLSPHQSRVLVVSHFYHLPRIKMTFQHYGIEAFTVPSENTVPFSMPFNLVREDLAFWWYYTRHLA